MIFINDSGAAVKIKEGFVVAEAEVYAEIWQEEESPSLIRNNHTYVQDDELSDNLTEMYYRSTPKLNDREKCCVNLSLVEYHDIFS